MNMIEAYKGIPPGKIIARNLEKRGLSQRKLSEEIGEHYQTMNAIIMGSRHLTISQSLKLDKALGFPDGFFAIVQTYYLIALAQKGRIEEKPVPSIRSVVFWDIDPEKLDWNKNKDFIVSRVNQRGNKEEIENVRKYYENR